VVLLQPARISNTQANARHRQFSDDALMAEARRKY
jgi:hypothetical protein